MGVTTAQFASRRAQLVVVEHPAKPQYEGGRLVGTLPGKYHQFEDHRLRVEGQKSIDFLRSRIKSPDSPEMWEVDASDVPSTTELLIEIATADVARVREILAAEQANSNREEVIRACTGVLKKMDASTRPPGTLKAHPRHDGNVQRSGD